MFYTSSGTECICANNRDTIPEMHAESLSLLVVSSLLKQLNTSCCLVTTPRRPFAALMWAKFSVLPLGIDFNIDLLESIDPITVLY